MVSLITGNGFEGGKYSSSKAAQYSYYTGRSMSLALLTPIIVACDAASFIKSSTRQRNKGWESSSRKCSLCKTEFGMVNRRHHCRCCGRPICFRCSRFLAIPASSPLRTAIRLSGLSSEANDKEGVPQYRLCSICYPSLKQGVLPPGYHRFVI